MMYCLRNIMKYEEESQKNMLEKLMQVIGCWVIMREVCTI